MAVISSVRNNFPSGLKDGDPNGLDDFPMVDLIIVENNAEFMTALKGTVVGAIRPGKIVFNYKLYADPNFLHNWGIWGPFIAIFLLFSVVNISIASFKLYQFIKHHGPKLMLSQIILGLEIFANLSMISSI